MPLREEQRRTEDLRRGMAIKVQGLGLFTVAGFRPLSGGECLIKLAWDSLALIGRKGQRWTVLTGAYFDATTQQQEDEIQVHDPSGLF